MFLQPRNFHHDRNINTEAIKKRIFLSSRLMEEDPQQLYVCIYV